MTIEQGLSYTAPTVQLPPTKKITSLPLEVLEESLCYLRVVYSPPVRGSRLVSRRTLFPLSRTQFPHRIPPLEESALDVIRQDRFERSYAIGWLTSFISLVQGEDVVWLVSSSGDDGGVQRREALVEDAASLLALCAGTASAGTLTRNFSFGQGLINVQITDLPLENCDFSSIGAQTWGGACVLAETIISNPDEFGLERDYSASSPLRILELGAGSGLVGIALAHCLSRIRQQEAFILCTDFHPAVLKNLGNNITANEGSFSSTVVMSSAFLDWSQPSLNSTFFSSSSDDDDHRSVQGDGTFDLILGADIVYELNHIIWIRNCLRLLLRKPVVLPEDGTSPTRSHPKFHLVVPLRPTHTLETHAIEDTIPFASSIPSTAAAGATPSDGGGGSYRGVFRMDLAIFAKDIITCDANGDGKEEVEYAYYVIGWQELPTC